MIKNTAEYYRILSRVFYIEPIHIRKSRSNIITDIG